MLDRLRNGWLQSAAINTGIVAASWCVARLGGWGVEGWVALMLTLLVLSRRPWTTQKAPDELGPSLEALRRSVTQAAVGDFSARVDVPVGHPLRELVSTYNAVLLRLTELMEARDAASLRIARAESAAEVLHNVANALTSVSAGTSLIQQRLLDWDSIPELRGAPHELEAFRDDVALVRAASDHAIELVRAQQRQARTQDSEAPTAIVALIEEAILMSSVGQRPHDVALHRDFDPEFVSSLDRHALLEILVNLLNNAYDAVLTCDRVERQIVIGLRRRNNSFEIGVTDNGPGIPAPDQARLFSYGFSTKPDGNGLGLHSSWNAANRMGGWLRLEPSHEGATFSIVLPLRHIAARPPDAWTDAA